jgi:hypothetical protein
VRCTLISYLHVCVHTCVYVCECRYVREQVTRASNQDASDDDSSSDDDGDGDSGTAAVVARKAAAAAHRAAEGLSLECDFVSGLAALLQALKDCLSGFTSTGELAVRSQAVSDESS